MRRQAVPEWVRYLIRELTRPPYFLEQIFNAQHHSAAGSGEAADQPPPGEHRQSYRNQSEQSKGASSTGRPSWSGSSHPRNPRRPATSGGDTERHTKTVGADARPADVRSEGSRSGNSRTEGSRSGGSLADDAHTEDVRAERVRWQGAPAAPVQRQGTARRAEFVPTAHKGKVRTAGKKRTWSSAFRRTGYPVALAKAYGWKVESAESVADIIKVATSQGNYALKRTHITPERVEFIYRATRYLRNQGFRGAPRFALSSEKLPGVEKDGHTYYATEWIEGNNVNFASLSQLGMLARTLAEFHELSRGFEWSAYNPPYEFGLTGLIRSRAADLKNLLTRAETRDNPDEFDQVLARMAPRLRHDAEKSLRIAEDQQCNKFLLEDEENPGLCHLDVIPGNFVYTADKEIYVLDMDLSTFAPRVLDLAHLLRRSLEQLNWQPDAAYTCFVQYDAVRPMTAEEYLWVQCLLTFPYRAWRLAHTRFHVFRDRRQTEELKEISAQESRRQSFLDAYGRQIMREVD
jgi:CotS family spore coat protein